MNGDFSLSRFGTVLAIRIQDDHVRFGQLRQIPGHRVIEQEVAFLVEHHHGQTRDRLRHRGEPEQRVCLHRLPVVDIGHAEVLEIGNLAIAGDHGHGTGNLFLVDGVLNLRSNPRQPVCRQSHVLR